MRRTITAAVAAALAGGALLIAPAGPAVAQDSGLRSAASDVPAQRRVRTARTRVVVTPSARFVRRCVDAYVIEHRATGDTVVPNMHCWWAYR